jgi:hypothetical protein
MHAKRRLAAILIALTFFGCSSGLETAVASGDASTSGGTRKEFIRDPSLNMNAYEITIPAKWHFQGVLYQSGNCVPTPFGVFRTTSPDGLTFVERMPVLGWAWGTGPMAATKQNDCLPMKQAISAQEFLKYLSATLKVEYVADEPVPAEIEAMAQKGLADARAVYAPKYAASHIEQPKETRQLARAVVRYKNGTFVMKGQLSTMVDCTTTHVPGMKSILRGMPDRPDSYLNQCNAGTRYLVAPENQFQAIEKLWDGKDMGGRGLAEWSQAWVARNAQQAQAAMNRMNAAAMAQRQASAQQFAHDQAVRQHMHEDFLATMQRGTDMSMNRAAQIANTNHTIASDWVDYSLDQQTVRDPNTGQVNKVSSSYSYTWVDSSGKTSFQTNDVNANPNGALQGNWTRQQVVHGDGSN